MLSWKLSGLAVLALRAFFVVAEAEPPTEADAEQVPLTTPNLNVQISTSFPQSEIFGVKLVNGHATQAVLSVKNQETGPVSVEFIGGSLFSLQNAQPVRNFTVERYGVEIPAGESESLTYSFATELHPQDFRLALQAVIRDEKQNYFTLLAYNETVSVVEAPMSFFDPQIIFLYLVLAAGFGGVCYFIYNTWITTLFPQKRGRGKGGERAKASSRGTKKVDPADQVSVVGADGPAVTSGAKAYDESWIPAGHLLRPEAKRIRSGTPKTKARP